MTDTSAQGALPEGRPAQDPSAPAPSPLLARHGAVAAAGPDAGVAWHYGDPTGEQRALAAGGAVVDQSHLGVVTVTGPDRLTWLNSITSQELTSLPPRTSTETMVLSPHGRVEHVAAVVDDGTTTWLITEPVGTRGAPVDDAPVGDAETADGPAAEGSGPVPPEGAPPAPRGAPALAAWLDSMRFMMRVEVTDVTADWAVLGEAVDAEGADGEPVTWCDPWPRTLPGGTRYGPPDAEHPGRERAWRLVLVPRAELTDAVAVREAAGWRLVGTWATEALRVEAWRPRAATDIDHRTIPHELDWLRTAVHLHKGCYRGQETIARVHNLGRPPRRLVMLHLDGTGTLIPDPGAEVRLGERSVGTVTSVARHHELGPIALGVVKRNTDASADLLADCDGGAVAAAQEVIVPGEGVSADRPPPPPPVTRGLTPRARP